MAPRSRKRKTSPCFVYVLGTHGKHGFKTYVGWTVDVAARLEAHNAGKGARSTRGHVWRLLYVERCDTKRAAMSREWHLKRDRAFRRQLRLTAGARSNRAA